jgi:hypothetical protein
MYEDERMIESKSMLSTSENRALTEEESQHVARLAQRENLRFAAAKQKYLAGESKPPKPGQQDEMSYRRLFQQEKEAERLKYAAQRAANDWAQSPAAESLALEARKRVEKYRAEGRQVEYITVLNELRKAKGLSEYFVN